MYQIIINKQLVSAEKISQRRHWLWGEQWLMEYGINIRNNDGTIAYTTQRVVWVSRKKVLTDKE